MSTLIVSPILDGVETGQGVRPPSSLQNRRFKRRFLQIDMIVLKRIKNVYD